MVRVRDRRARAAREGQGCRKASPPVAIAAGAETGTGAETEAQPVSTSGEPPHILVDSEAPVPTGRHRELDAGPAPDRGPARTGPRFREVGHGDPSRGQGMDAWHRVPYYNHRT